MTLRSAINTEIDRLYATEPQIVGDLAMLTARQYDVVRGAAGEPATVQAIIDMNSAISMNANGYYERGQAYNWNEPTIGDVEQIINRNVMATAEEAADPATQEAFSGSGTFMWPVGVTTATVKCFGAGGGSGVQAKGEGGGGGGASATKAVIKTASTATVTIGAGGTQGVAGGDTTFVQGVTTNVKAKGGSAGLGPLGGAGGDETLCIGDTSFAGGRGGDTGSGATILDGGGGGGSSAGTTQDGNDGEHSGATTGGAGGAAPAGGYSGGDGGDMGETGAGPFLGIAGGAGGAGTGANGLTGGNGYCLVTWESPAGDTEVNGKRGSFNLKINEYYKSKPHNVGDALMLAARQIVG